MDKEYYRMKLRIVQEDMSGFSRLFKAHSELITYYKAPETAVATGPSWPLDTPRVEKTSPKAVSMPVEGCESARLSSAGVAANTGKASASLSATHCTLGIESEPSSDSYSTVSFVLTGPPIGGGLQSDETAARFFD
jgi:hypothetical protein